MKSPRPGFASVVRGGSVVGTSQIVSAGLASLISIVLALQLGADGFGACAIAMTFVIFIGAIASMGQSHIVIVNLALIGDHPDRSDPVWTSVGIGALSSLILAAGTFAMFEFGPWGPPPEVGLSGSVFAAILIVTSTANALISESFRGINRLGHHLEMLGRMLVSATDGPLSERGPPH